MVSGKIHVKQTSGGAGGSDPNTGVMVICITIGLLHSLIICLVRWLQTCLFVSRLFGWLIFFMCNFPHFNFLSKLIYYSRVIFVYSVTFLGICAVCGDVIALSITIHWHCFFLSARGGTSKKMRQAPKEEPLIYPAEPDEYFFYELWFSRNEQRVKGDWCVNVGQTVSNTLMKICPCEESTQRGVN